MFQFIIKYLPIFYILWALIINKHVINHESIIPQIFLVYRWWLRYGYYKLQPNILSSYQVLVALVLNGQFDFHI